MNLNNLKLTLLITAISRLDLFVNLINNTNQIMKTTELKTQTGNLIIDNPTLYWILQVVITIAIFIVVYQIFKKIYELKDDLKMQIIINKSRNILNFKEQYKSNEYYLLPNESIQDFNKRNLNGIYDKKIQEEVNLVYKESLNIFKHKSITEIETLISKNYSL